MKFYCERVCSYVRTLDDWCKWLWFELACDDDDDGSPGTPLHCNDDGVARILMFQANSKIIAIASDKFQCVIFQTIATLIHASISICMFCQFADVQGRNIQKDKQQIHKINMLFLVLATHARAPIFHVMINFVKCTSFRSCSWWWQCLLSLCIAFSIFNAHKLHIKYIAHSRMLLVSFSVFFFFFSSFVSSFCFHHSFGVRCSLAPHSFHMIQRCARASERASERVANTRECCWYECVYTWTGPFNLGSYEKGNPRVHRYAPACECAYMYGTARRRKNEKKRTARHVRAPTIQRMRAYTFESCCGFFFFNKHSRTTLFCVALLFYAMNEHNTH